jgi:predicted ATPase
MESAQTRSASVTHIGTQAYEKAIAVWFEQIRGDLARAAPRVFELARLAREHELRFWEAFAVFFEGVARAEGRAPSEGLADMRRGVQLLRDQNILGFDGLVKLALAEAEARAGDADRALAILDEALATSERIGHRTFDAVLHRVRGEILLKRGPANPAPAEEALLTAGAVAQRQGTHAFELRAALSLAKLYQSTARAADAHAVLAPALEGFSPTPEMPEIAEAQALHAALAETDAVKADAAQRERRLRLQNSYGRALMWSKGYAADEANAAFARAAELAASTDGSSERFSSSYGQLLGRLLRGEYREAEYIARRLLNEAETAKRGRETAQTRNAVGQICLYQGKVHEAQTAFEGALVDWTLAKDSPEPLQSWIDPEVMATSNLAHVAWLVGDPARARRLSHQAIQRANELGHAQTRAQTLLLTSLFETLRDDPAAALRSTDLLLELARELGMELESIRLGRAVDLLSRGPAPQGCSKRLLTMCTRATELLCPSFLDCSPSAKPPSKTLALPSRLSTRR